jgi:hypothetical protein
MLMHGDTDNVDFIHLQLQLVEHHGEEDNHQQAPDVAHKLR